MHNLIYDEAWNSRERMKELIIIKNLNIENKKGKIIFMNRMRENMNGNDDDE